MIRPAGYNSQSAVSVAAASVPLLALAHTSQGVIVNADAFIGTVAGRLCPWITRKAISIFAPMHSTQRSWKLRTRFRQSPPHSARSQRTLAKRGAEAFQLCVRVITVDFDTVGER